MNKPLKFILDPSLGRIVLSYEEVDMVELEKISQSRLDICKSCDNFIIDPSMYKCQLCGCNLQSKIKRFYPFDAEGKAAIWLLPDGNFIPVCPLKKW